MIIGQTKEKENEGLESSTEQASGGKWHTQPIVFASFDSLRSA